jgi:inosine-uridine nucleoside N-ribohydrolase
VLVHIDTDVALGAGSGDVDDGFAIAAVLRSPRLRLTGVTTVFGNTSSGVAARCARRLLDLAGSRVEVIEGAAGPGRVGAAAEAIAALPAGAHVLALGPLTNVAQALALDPSLAARVTVSLVGGNLSSWGRWPPLWPFEFNLAKDPDAAHALFRSATPRRVYPLDVAARLTVGARFLARIRRAGPLGRALAAGSWRWLARAPLRYRSLRFPLWDLVPALDLAGLLPHQEETRHLRCDGRGRLVDDGGAEPAVCLRALDPVPARTAFEQLLC